MTISPTLIVGTSTSILEIEQEHLGRQKIKEIPLKNKIGKISAVTYNSLSGMYNYNTHYTIVIGLLNFNLKFFFYYKVILSSMIQNLKNYLCMI